MISVLYVDDEFPLLDLCKYVLEKTGDFTIDTHISAQSALDALTKNSFDCIVSDYQMPDMNGIEFLQALRSQSDTTPFIIFTGKGREEVAMQALNSGADFYLQKGGGKQDVQFVELAHIITQAVRRKKGEEALRKSEQRYRNVVESQTEFVVRFLPDGTHKVANAAYCRYFGKSCEEMINSRFIPNIPEEDKGLVRQHFASLTPENAVATIEHRSVMPDGSVRWQQWSDRAIFDANGTLLEYQSVGRDITERKRAEEELRRKSEELQAAYEELTTADEELRQNYDELVTMEKKLRESEQRYRNVVEDQNEFISRFLPDGTHVFVNEAYCRYFNKKREEILGTRFIPKVLGKERALVKQHFASLTPENPVATIEHRIVMPDGQVRWQRWSDRAIFDAGGRVTEYQSVGQDITDRREAEELVQISEVRYRSLFEGVPVGLYRSTPAGRFLNANPALVHILGYPDRESLLAISISDLYADPETRKEWQARMEHEGIVYDFEAQFRKSDKTIIWVWETSRAVRDDSGQVVYYEGILEDITRRKQAEEDLNRKNEELNAAFEQLTAVEEELRTSFNDLANSQKALAENKATLDSIIEESPIPQFVIDRNHRVMHWNHALAEYSGVTAESVIGTTGHWRAFYDKERPCLADLLLDGEADKVSAWYEGKFRKSTLIDDAYEAADFFPRMTGEGKWLYFTAGLVRDPDGKVIGAVETLQDITDERQAQEALSQANKKLNLLSSVTRHDILNQLTALIGYLDISRMLVHDPVKLGEFIRKEIVTAETIEKQILFTRDYQNMGIKVPVWQNVNVNISRAVSSLPMRDIRVAVDRIDFKVLADPLFEKVFYNLIDNALKHGGDTITAVRFSSHESDHGMTIVCEDDGVGISRKEKNHLFERGFGKHTGLGLYLVREILSITGITIRETSKPGKGARFEIFVPKGTYRFRKMQQ